MKLTQKNYQTDYLPNSSLKLNHVRVVQLDLIDLVNPMTIWMIDKKRYGDENEKIKR
jgi:hypothetical protein